MRFNPMIRDKIDKKTLSIVISEICSLILSFANWVYNHAKPLNAIKQNQDVFQEQTKY